VLFAQLFPGASKSLTSMADRLVLDSSEGDDRHGALLDADMTADALILMEHQLKYGETVPRDHGPRPDRRDGIVNKRHSANAAPDRAVDHLRGIRGVAREENRRSQRPHEVNAGIIDPRSSRRPR
jgi:DNA polymerase III epsilon subunit-like protein